MITVRSWGIAGAVVDGGRSCQMWLGKSRGGALDVESLILANRLVGNSPLTVGYESCGGLSLEFSEAVLVAVTGAVAALTVTDGPPVGWGSAVLLPAGSVLQIGRLIDGARVYVGVRSADAAQSPVAEAVPRAALSTILGVWPGPRRDWFQEAVWNVLCRSTFSVTATSRVGVRLAGPALERSRRGELPSEGVIEGAIQVPPDGQPIVMLADHPTTGGYPVIAVVEPADIHHLAQAAVGTELRFRALH